MSEVTNPFLNRPFLHRDTRYGGRKELFIFNSDFPEDEVSLISFALETTIVDFAEAERIMLYHFDNKYRDFTEAEFLSKYEELISFGLIRPMTFEEYKNKPCRKPKFAEKAFMKRVYGINTDVDYYIIDKIADQTVIYLFKSEEISRCPYIRLEIRQFQLGIYRRPSHYYERENDIIASFHNSIFSLGDPFNLFKEGKNSSQYYCPYNFC